jgi:hypothetical protein
VASGDEVAPGTVLGSLVATDSHCPPAACLHWGLLRGDTYLDPLALVGAQLQVRLLPVWGDGSMPPARRSAEGGHSPFVLETVDRIDPLTRLVRSPDAAERWTASAGPAR